MENQLLIALSKNKLLQNIDISKIDLQNVKGKLITLAEGEILYREGDTAEIIFLLVSGQINILKKRLLGKTKSYLFRENDFFGHEEYFEETSRTSTAVALVDSYLIALNREEMDQLIRQNDEILVNLKEPVPENFVEDLLRKEKLKTKVIGEDSEDMENLHEEDNETVVQPTVVDEGKTMDFFKSISDFSRSRESNLIPPLKTFEKEIESVDTPQEKTPDELPQETSNKEEEKPVEDEIQTNEIKIPEVDKFDENIFLNEDGIPKAEFELPVFKNETETTDDLPADEKVEEVKDIPSNMEPKPEKSVDDGLDDALFQILSGNSIPYFEPLQENVIVEETKPIAESGELETPQIEEPQIKNIPEPEPEKEINASIEKSEIMGNSFQADSKIERDFDKGLVEEEPVEEKTIDEFERPVSVFPEEYGAPQEEDKPEEKKKFDFPTHMFGVLEKINSSINLTEVLRSIAEAAKVITSSDVCLIFRVDWLKNELWTMIETGFGKREIRFKVGDGITGLSAKTGEAVVINSISKDRRFNFDLEKNFCETAGSVLAFPIRNKKNEIVALLELIKKRPFEFNEEHEDKLKLMSIAFSNAIRNAEQAENLIKREREFSLSKVATFLEQEIKKPVLLSKRYTEHLKSKQLPPDVENILSSLFEQLNMLSDVVTTTANYSENRIPLRIMTVSLNNSLRDFSSKAEQYVESRFSQIINEFGGDTTVKMDVKEFYQCYIFLIKNACEAMPDGGKITVSTKKTDHAVEIHIKDNGRGISDDIKQKIFDPFFSEGKREGTGIGLAIAKRVVEAHNGTIKVNSTIGEGSDFIITLPIVSAF